MDGRWIRTLGLSGCVLFGALGCSNKNTIQPPFGSTTPGQPVAELTNPMYSPKSFWNSNKPSQAAEMLAEPMRDGPAKPDTHAVLANVQLDSALDQNTPQANREALLDSARAGYVKALQQDPKNKTALLGLAKYYVRLGDRGKALETYKRYFAAYPKDMDVAHEVAIAHAQWKDWAGAAAWCDFALKIDPENLSIRKTMAFCLARGGKWEEGFQVMCQVMPEAHARYLMARVLEHQNQPDACRTQLQLAINADPNYAPARDFLAELDHVTSPNGQSNPIRQAGATEPDQN